MSNNRIEVDTFFGKLFAEVSGNPDYPGIHICVEQQGAEGKYERQLALVECTPDKPEAGLHTLRLLVWVEEDTEDSPEEYTFAEEEPLKVVWEKYLQYLRVWADSHAGPGFAGMTPACYDEWRDGEYAQEMEGLV